jgi:hypothetical protein
MSTREEIVNEINRLNARLLAFSSYDAEFTPRELIRWNPSLIGSMLHIKHPSKLKRSALGKVQDVREDMELEQFGILTNDGINIPDEITACGKLIFHMCNSFDSLTKIPISFSGNMSAIEDLQKEYGIDTHMLYQTTNIYGIKSYIQGYVPLISNTTNPLDAIYVATYVRIPFFDDEYVVDKYPLARLYEHWKQEKILRLARPARTLVTRADIVADAEGESEPRNELIDKGL